MTLEWLLTNDTLTKFDIDRSTIEDGDAQSICHLLSRVFRCIKSLKSVHFPSLSIIAEDMDGLINALTANMSMTFINFSACALGQDAWNRLEHSLLQESPNKISISSIQLPSGDKPTLKSVLRNLTSMSGIQEVEISDNLDAEENKLLLQAVKGKNTLLSFTTGDGSSGNVDMVRCPVEKETDFYLKLNSFGRRILNNTNVYSSLWPILLARMTRASNDADALFFFLREYFLQSPRRRESRAAAAVVVVSGTVIATPASSWR
jgi:hypothetical protein